MRRNDREVTDIDEMERILRRCTVCHLAIHRTPYPYIVPLNFGYRREGDAFTLFFHCAAQGEKTRLLRLNPHGSFAMECNTRLVAGKEACQYSMAYESVCGCGIIETAHGEEKARALEAIMRQYAPGRAFAFPPEELSVEVLCLKVAQITGKRNIRDET